MTLYQPTGELERTSEEEFVAYFKVVYGVVEEKHRNINQNSCYCSRVRTTTSRIQVNAWIKLPG
jgi:hypothetical protein